MGPALNLAKSVTMARLGPIVAPIFDGGFVEAWRAYCGITNSIKTKVLTFDPYGNPRDNT